MISVITQRQVNLSMLYRSFLLLVHFPSHWLLHHITIVEMIVSGENGVNPVAMAIRNPLKEICLARYQIPNSSSEVL